MFKTIDIHGMVAAEAKRYIEKVITEAPRHSEITVIHGYHGGQKLQTMVRNLKHKRIKQKMLSLNSGETILIIE